MTAQANNNNNNLLDEFRSSSLNPQLLQSLLHRLLSHPKIYNGFVDILKLTSVQTTLGKLDESKRAVLVRTVELFAHGTIKDYYELKEKDEVWTLNDAQLEKLRMLSVVSFAREQIDKFHSSGDTSGGRASSPPSGGGLGVCDDVEMMAGLALKKRLPKKKKKMNKNQEGGMLSISYSRLASELHIPDNGKPYDEKTHMRLLEDLLIQCIYANVIAAKLDQSLKCAVILTHELGGSNKKGNASGGGGVYGSVLSRDLKTSTPVSTNVEVSRMISTLQQFLKQSNSLLSTLEHSSNAVLSDRKLDELRWKELLKVQNSLDDAPSKLRESSASSGGGGGGMGMGPMGGVDGGDPMEVVDLAGRRQVKRSKGGHSMMMGGGGGVRFS